MTDPFESYERKINDLKDEVRLLQKGRSWAELVFESTNDENRRLRDACRQTNKGISRLRRRCDSQAKKIDELKAIVREAMSLAYHTPPQHWIEAVEGRRPEKAT